MQVKIIDNVTPKLNKLTPKMKQNIGKKLIDIASYVQTKALYYAYESPAAKYSKTRNLASSIRVNVNTAQGTATVRADGRTAKYARIVEYGARPHEIPNNPIWAGRTHPGIEGKYFMTRAGVDARLLAPRKISEGIRFAIRDSGFKTR